MWNWVNETALDAALQQLLNFNTFCCYFFTEIGEPNANSCEVNMAFVLSLAEIFSMMIITGRTAAPSCVRGTTQELVMNTTARSTAC